MFVKVQRLDTICVPVLSSDNAALSSNVNGGFSLPLPHHRAETKLEQRKPVRKHLNPHPPRFDDDKKAGFCRRRSKADVVAENPGRGTSNHEKNRGFRGSVWSREENSAKKKSHAGCSTKCVTENGPVTKPHTRCLMKRPRYGGCIPAILEALERVKDLDEAFKPWENGLNNKERTIILKEQHSWERAMEIFEWFKIKSCYEINVIHYNIMIRILGQAHRWNELETLRNEMESRGIASINSTFGTLIHVYSTGGHQEKAMQCLEKMGEQNMDPDETTMGIIVQMYKKASLFEKAEDFFKNWRARNDEKPTKIARFDRESKRLSPFTYNTLIDTYGKAGRLKDASETFERMLKEGIVPTTVTFNTMIHMFGNHGRYEEAVSLLRKMEHLRCVPDTRTYNILISLHGKRDNIVTAVDCFRKMKAAALEPDAVSYRTLLRAFATRRMVREAEELVDEMDETGVEIDEFTQSSVTRMYVDAGLLEKSWSWFERFHVDGKMTPECYAANIDAFGERGHVLQAENVFGCCLERGTLTVLAFNVMIKAYGIDKRYDEACRLFDGMETHDVFPDTYSFNSLIQLLAGADFPRKAMFYVQKLRKSGLPVDCVPYCAAMSSFVRLRQPEAAVGVYEEMVANGVSPDVVVFGVLINAYADVGDVDGALTYMTAMNDFGVPMNGVVCRCLIKLYSKVGWLKHAEAAYYDLQRLVGVDAYSSNCMIDLYSRQSMVRPAEQMFEKLRRNQAANEFSHAMMLCMYRRIGSFDEAFGVARRMRESGLLSELLSYNHVIGLCACDGRFKEAVEVFEEMTNRARVEPDDSTFRSLGVVLMKRGVSRETVAGLEAARKRDRERGLAAWMAVLRSVIGPGPGPVSTEFRF